MPKENHEVIIYNNINNLIFTIRGEQVILDRDIALLYGVETKRVNESVKRNKDRFPETFCFKLTVEEVKNLRSQIATSKKSNNYGGTRYLPYAFSECGVAMLSSVLKSKQAINISIKIIEAFVQMRKELYKNESILKRINEIELNHTNFINLTNEKFNRIFDIIEIKKEENNKVFYEGEVFDAYSFIIDLIKKAKKSILLIDNYVDIVTLNILKNRNNGVNIKIFTKNISNINNIDLNKFNLQYNDLTLIENNKFHDRFLIIDNMFIYHIGASLKDAGKKCFAINKINDEKILNAILECL